MSRHTHSSRLSGADIDVQTLGSAPPMRALIGDLLRVAETEASVFIVGESGTGKELIAQAIHQRSPRRAQPFVPVNCGAISASLAHTQLFGHEKGSFTGALARTAGYFEHADSGTLFLDELTEMHAEMQAQFLRVLESGVYYRVGGVEPVRTDVRIICATNRDPHAAVAAGKLRADLLHRLLVVPLRVPPLRERPEDIPYLAQRFLDEFNKAGATRKRFSRPALDALSAHSWPGNVRELRNVVQRAYIISDDVIEAAGLVLPRPPLRTEFTQGELRVGIGTPLMQAQRDLILVTLAHHGGDKRRAARTLGISLKTLYNRLDGYEAAEGAEARTAH